MGRYLVGISAATVGTTASVYDVDGKKLGSGFVESVFHFPQPGSIVSEEKDVLDCTFTACRQAIRASGIDPKEVVAAAFATQACVFCLLDKDGRVIGDMIGWQDARSATGVNLGEFMDREEIYDLTLLAPDAGPSSYLLKLLWLRKNDPEIFEKTRMFATQQDYFLRRFGVDGHRSDIASLARQNMIDVKARAFCLPVFEKLGLEIERFPGISASGVPIGRVSREAAEKSGLCEGTLLCVGAHDQSCYQMGVGALYPGDNFMLISTMGTCAVVCEEPVLDPLRTLTVKPNPGFGHWSIEGLTSCSAGSYRWFRDAFGCAKGGEAYESINAQVAQSKPGANGITFIPYLQGAFGAKPNPGARGAFIGMNVGTTRADMARAVMEGITYELYDIIECERAAGVALNKIRLTGLAADLPLWCQTVANILQTPVEVTAISETGTLGAAMLAGVGAGVYKDVYEAANQLVSITREYLPDPATASLYAEGFERYLAIIEGLEFSRVY